MTIQHKNNALINALRALYFRVSELELSKRIGFYRPRTNSETTSDISAPLVKHINKLAAQSSQNKDAVAVQKKIKPPDKFKSKIEKAKVKPNLVNLMLDGLASYYRKSAGKQVSDQYMGEKLKKSTWTHIHTALMQARAGEVSTAKLHADIANQSLKEAAHYMSDEEYKALCEEVDVALSDLNNIF